MPYRAMPLPGPRRSWRPLVETLLALFNAAALVALALWWVHYQNNPHDYRDGYKADEVRVLAGAALVGAIGFLGWFSYRWRLRFILASGLFWAFIGAVVLFYGLSPCPYVLRVLGRDYCVTMGGVVYVGVGLASIATFRSRDRTRTATGRAVS
jgi:hypothetical protein